MPLAVTDFPVDGVRVYSIVLKDRRQRPHRQKSWLFKQQAESAIFGARETSNGALNKLYVCQRSNAVAPGRAPPP